MSTSVTAQAPTADPLSKDMLEDDLDFPDEEGEEEEEEEEEDTAPVDDIPISTVLEMLKSNDGLVNSSLDLTNVDAADFDLEKLWGLLATAGDVPCRTEDGEIFDARDGEVETVRDDIQTFAKAVIAKVAVAVVVEIGKRIIRRIWRSRSNDNQGRSQFTQNTIRQARQNDPGFNYVVIRRGIRYRVRFGGMENQDWSRSEIKFPLRSRRSMPYDVYAFREGQFELRGDGGFLNWSYGGNVVSDSGDRRRPRIVNFARPSPHRRTAQLHK